MVHKLVHFLDIFPSTNFLERIKLFVLYVNAMSVLVSWYPISHSINSLYFIIICSERNMEKLEDRILLFHYWRQNFKAGATKKIVYFSTYKSNNFSRSTK